MFWGMAAVMAAAALVRFLCTKGAARAAFYASKEVTKALRGLIYRKLLRLGAAYTQNVPTAEVVQLCLLYTSAGIGAQFQHSQIAAEHCLALHVVHVYIQFHIFGTGVGGPQAHLDVCLLYTSRCV